MFYVGQKVVCVDASGKSLITKGHVYHVTSVNMPFIRVDCTPDVIDGTEASRGYYHYRFRPIIERKTDISIFTAMLTPAGKEKVDG